MFYLRGEVDEVGDWCSQQSQASGDSPADEIVYNRYVRSEEIKASFELESSDEEQPTDVDSAMDGEEKTGETVELCSSSAILTSAAKRGRGVSAGRPSTRPSKRSEKQTSGENMAGGSRGMGAGRPDKQPPKKRRKQIPGENVASVAQFPFSQVSRAIHSQATLDAHAMAEVRREKDRKYRRERTARLEKEKLERARQKAAPFWNRFFRRSNQDS